MENWRSDKNQCPSCEAMMIQGVYCHESGCPDKWRNETHECKWCGSQFVPDAPDQSYCCEECGISYNA